MTPQQLFDYADRFATRSEEANKGTQYPTFRQVANRFKVTYNQIEDAVDDGQVVANADYFGVGIGISVPGMGYASHDSRGEWVVEAEPKREGI